MVCFLLRKCKKMNDIKEIIAKNIVELRLENGITQLELAKELNYSDKAVSKWEHADAMPDITVLVKIADLFGVTLDYLVRTHTQNEVKEKELEKANRPFRYSKKVITALSISLVWLLAVFFFVVLSAFNKPSVWHVMCFVYALPIQTVVWLILNSIWFSPKRNYIIISLLMWSGLLALHLTLMMFGMNLWRIYLLGIPGEIIIILWSVMKRSILSS